ncbi:hypothetical protein B0J14DRAFT_611835 [Halenospora varia]|nr:hypothetical protein B0J14DRAFT_611835 [Halenospora varia]
MWLRRGEIPNAKLFILGVQISLALCFRRLCLAFVAEGNRIVMASFELHYSQIRLVSQRRLLTEVKGKYSK